MRDANRKGGGLVFPPNSESYPKTGIASGRLQFGGRRGML
jgi:hypothetical protein